MSEDRADTISIEAYLFIEIRSRVYRYRLKHVVTSVGSHDDNVVRIMDDSVRDHHLLLTYVDGAFFLRRVGDATVRLNDRSIETFSEELRYGDSIGLGDVRIRLVEGGAESDVAILLVDHRHVEGPATPPWHVFMSRKTEIRVGPAPSDLLLPTRSGFVIENFGLGAQYLVPPKSGDHLKLNEKVVKRRVVLNDRDVIDTTGHSFVVRFLKGEAMDEPGGLIGPDLLRRLLLHGGREL